MRNTTNPDGALPEIDAFSPIETEQTATTPILNPAKPALKPVAEAATLAPQSQPLPLIGKGGYTLAVPGAENMAAPYAAKEVSTKGRSASDPLVAIVGEEKIAGTKTWTERLGSKLGLSVMANAILLAACAHQIALPGSDATQNKIAQAPTTIEKVASADVPAPRVSDAVKDEENNLTPRRVKVERFKVTKGKVKPVAALEAQPTTNIDLTKNIDEIAQAEEAPVAIDETQVALAPGIAIPRAKPELPPKLFTRAVATSGSFVKELAALRDGKRAKPITIVHMGDSHIASDAFTRGIRNGLQAEYGNAGRGAVLPAKAFKWTRADGVKLATSGVWSSASSLTTKTGPYGLSGVRVWSSSSSAKMTLTAEKNPFDWAEVTVLTGPQQGRVKIVSGGESKIFSATAPTVGSKVFRVNAYSKTLVVQPAGGGRTTILNWATGRETPGIRYVNFGIVSATAYLQKRWTPKLLANDIKHLNPDLVVWGYGTNEGFNSNLDMEAYRRQVESIYSSVSAAAPKADWLFLGPASGLSRRGKAAGYCNGYRIPLKLGAVRNTLREFASENGRHYWDWAAAMGGDCAIDTWARANPKKALSDRVHLNRAGYQKSADALVAHIKSLIDKPQVVAAVNVEAID